MIVKSADSLESVQVDEKGRYDFVTEVDRRSEETILYHIKKAYPDHRFLCEESGASGNPDSDVEWIIDPLSMAPPISCAAYPMSPYPLAVALRAVLSMQ